MKSLIVLFTCLAFVLTLAGNRLDERSFKVNPGGSLVIDLISSDISLNVWTSNEVQVRTGEDNRLDITQNGNTVLIRSSVYSPDIMINIPRNISVKVKTTAGNLKLNGDIKGDFEIINSGGNISFNNIEGDIDISIGGGNISGGNISGSVKVESLGGDISFGNLKGKSSVKTGGGNIRLSSASQTEMIKTNGGNIMIKNAKGKGSISTGAGNIDINSCSGNLSISTFGGDIRLGDTEGVLSVKTGGGEIRIREVKGNLNARTEAGEMLINFTRQTKKSEISSGNGSIKVNIDPNLNTTITARAKDPNWWKDESAGSESISSDFKLYSLKRNKGNQQVESVYQVNRGGIPINIQTGYGEIIIRKR